jgi:hypothetical protein
MKNNFTSFKLNDKNKNKNNNKNDLMTLLEKRSYKDDTSIE